MTRLTTAQLLDIIDLNRDISHLGMNLSAVMNLIVQRLLELLDIDGVVIELKEDNAMVYRACAGIAESFLGKTLPVSQSLSGHCLLSGMTQHCSNVEKDPRVNLAASRQVGIRSMLLVPLHYYEMPVAVLKVMSTRLRRFSLREIEFLERVAEQLGSAMYFCTRFSSDSLLYQATHDAMTDLANRSVFMESLRESVRKANQHVLVLMIDMNGLKTINDTYGHRFGDAALVEIARRLKSGSRPGDVVARLGGDEFALVMTFPERPDSQQVIMRLRKHVNRDFAFEDFRRELSVSIGYAIYPGEDSSIELLLHRADLRMYADKQTCKITTDPGFEI
ncbi:MAG TPA: GGDEF domain-containing protein [Rheinheimera sp.]|nr:GGDEF domain-containing protein [Rheinheimera sp.]